VNTSGLTGLLITTSPFTLRAHVRDRGNGAVENSLVPKFSSTSYPLTISLGLASNREIALRTAYLYRNEDPGLKSRGMGDTELSFKWSVFPQPENHYRPGIAVLASGSSRQATKKPAPTASVTGAAGPVLPWEAR